MNYGIARRIHKIVFICVLCGIGCLDMLPSVVYAEDYKAVKEYKKSARKRIAAYEEMDDASTNTENTSRENSKQKSSIVQSSSGHKKNSAFQNYLKNSSITQKYKNHVKENQIKKDTEKVLTQAVQVTKDNTKSVQSYWEKIKTYINSLIETIKKYLNAFLKKFGYGDLVEK